MSQPIIPLNLPVADPDLKDVLDAWRTSIMLDTNCHAIATIQAINEKNGKFVVDATVNYSRTYYVQQADGTYVAEQRAYPQLLDMPLVVLGGGSTALQFPVAQGDQCLVLFNDRDLNNWFAGAHNGPVASARLHSFSDGMALVGFQHIGTFDPTRALLTNGNARIGVPLTGAKVTVANNSTTLNTLLGSLITAIKGITTSNAVVGVPCTISPASQATLTSIATQLGTLLE